MNNNIDKKYVLTMSEEQARIVSAACEFYTRMKCGQWQELIPTCVDLSRKDFCTVRDVTNPILLQARTYAFPELQKTFGHSYGVGHDENADIAWEVYEVLRHTMAWTNHPEGGNTVDFGIPISFSGKALAKCRIEKEEKI